MNTSPSAAGSPPRNVRQRVRLASDDDLEPTLVLPADQPGRPHTDFEARSEAHRRHILTIVPDWYNRPATMQLALGALAVYNLRPDCTPVEEVNILWALEGNSHIRATMVCSLPTMG